MNTWKRLCCSALLAGAVALPSVANAAISVEGGAFATNGSTSLGYGASLGLLALPAVPVSSELTLITTGNGNGSAGTVDVRLNANGTTIGAGVGVGNVGNTSTTSVLFDGILAQTIAPHTAVEARIYTGPQRPSAFFGGLRLTF